MQSVTILRALWHRRIAVILVAVAAIGAGWALTYHLSFPPQARSYSVGVATARILVDTPRSQVVEVAPEGANELGTRANVLANLMTDGEIKGLIARRVGLTPEKLITSSDSADAPAAVPPGPRDHAYSTSVVLTSDMVTLPIIRVESQAPDVAGAIKLADGVVAGLKEYLDSKAQDEGVSDTRRLRVRALGIAQGHKAVRGPRRIMGLLVAMVVFLGGCAAILIFAALVRGWRAASVAQRDFSDDDAAWLFEQSDGGDAGQDAALEDDHKGSVIDAHDSSTTRA